MLTLSLVRLSMLAALAAKFGTADVGECFGDTFSTSCRMTERDVVWNANVVKINMTVEEFKETAFSMDIGGVLVECDLYLKKGKQRFECGNVISEDLMVLLQISDKVRVETTSSNSKMTGSVETLRTADDEDAFRIKFHFEEPRPSLLLTVEGGQILKNNIPYPSNSAAFIQSGALLSFPLFLILYRFV